MQRFQTSDKENKMNVLTRSLEVTLWWINPDWTTSPEPDQLSESISWVVSAQPASLWVPLDQLVQKPDRTTWILSGIRTQDERLGWSEAGFD